MWLRFCNQAESFTGLLHGCVAAIASAYAVLCSSTRILRHGNPSSPHSYCESERAKKRSVGFIILCISFEISLSCSCRNMLLKLVGGIREIMGFPTEKKETLMKTQRDDWGNETT